MEITTHPPGTPCWIDLGAPDPAAAAQFYGTVFGWTITDLGPDAGNYRMCELRGKPVAGLGQQQQPDVPPFWMTYISVSDVDATTEAVRKAGGQVLVEPMDVMGQGRMAVFADNTGVPISAWQPGQHVGAQLVNEPGTLCWNELNTFEPDKAKAFYPSVFGWSAEPMEGGPPNYTVWKLGGKTIGGMMPLDDSSPAQARPQWLICIAVNDAEATVTQASELGAKITVPPTDIKPGRFSVLTDPQGAIFSIIRLDPSLVG